jgi:hypothetical protein
MDFKSLLGELLIKQAPKTVSVSEQGVVLKSLSKDGRHFCEVSVQGQTCNASCEAPLQVGNQCLVTIHKALEDITRKDGSIIQAGTVWATVV